MTKKMKPPPVRGYGFEDETGGFATIIIGQRRFTARQVRERMLGDEKK